MSPQSLAGDPRRESSQIKERKKDDLIAYLSKGVQDMNVKRVKNIRFSGCPLMGAYVLIKK